MGERQSLPLSLKILLGLHVDTSFEWGIHIEEMVIELKKDPTEKNQKEFLKTYHYCRSNIQ